MQSRIREDSMPGLTAILSALACGVLAMVMLAIIRNPGSGNFTAKAYVLGPLLGAMCIGSAVYAAVWFLKLRGEVRIDPTGFHLIDRKHETHIPWPQVERIALHTSPSGKVLDITGAFPASPLRLSTRYPLDRVLREIGNHVPPSTLEAIDHPTSSTMPPTTPAR